jgi:hypothetical protein
MASSKKGVSAHQLHTTLQIGYEAAWFMAHRIREAMRLGGLSPMGGGGGVVEVDETYIGRLEGQPKRRTGDSHKNIVLTLVERGGSSAGEPRRPKRITSRIKKNHNLDRLPAAVPWQIAF